MSDFAQRADEYLQLRRALGFKLNHHGRALRQFVAYLDAVGASIITADHAIAWAGLPQRVQPIWLSQRLGVVRGFARYMQAFDPATEVPSLGIWRPDTRRPVPHLYSQDEVSRLLAAARELKPELRAASHETLLGLLSVSGMRVGEALSLSRDEVDLAEGGSHRRAREVQSVTAHTTPPKRDERPPRVRREPRPALSSTQNGCLLPLP
jgi:integrase/recombinase XerD